MCIRDRNLHAYLGIFTVGYWWKRNYLFFIFSHQAWKHLCAIQHMDIPNKQFQVITMNKLPIYPYYLSNSLFINLLIFTSYKTESLKFTYFKIPELLFLLLSFSALLFCSAKNSAAVIFVSDPNGLNKILLGSRHV